MNLKESTAKINLAMDNVDRLIHSLPTNKLIKPTFKKFKSKHF
jgi:hypothetical protein